VVAIKEQSQSGGGPAIPGSSGVIHCANGEKISLDNCGEERYIFVSK
jgi:hypothetical protein